jgi:lysosomal acid lipase/cholesteryl ester hydrolase
MARIPLIGRLSWREYIALFFGLLFLVAESLLHIVILLLPKFILNFFYLRSRTLFHRISGPPKLKSEEKRMADRILNARDFGELCAIYGYTPEEHGRFLILSSRNFAYFARPVVLTKDGYLLGLHRLPSKKGQQKASHALLCQEIVY